MNKQQVFDWPNFDQEELSYQLAFLYMMQGVV